MSIGRFGRSRNRVVQLYARAGRKFLKRRDIDDYVNGRARLESDGTLELTYNFSTPEQVEDFVLVDGSCRLEDRRLRLHGECRLLFGEPFREWLSVSAVVARYDATRPNINIALWTREDDKVTYVGSRVMRSPSGSTPSSEEFDYLAFGVGYSPESRSSLGVTLRMVDSTFEVPGPCFAIIGGAHKIPLHGMSSSSYRLDCFWGESVLNKVKGPQRIDLVLKPTSLSWIVNRRQLHLAAFKKQPTVMRRLARAGAAGSVTLFTNNRTVHYSMLKVRGEFNPAWLDALAKRRATEELSRLEERTAPPK